MNTKPKLQNIAIIIALLVFLVISSGVYAAGNSCSSAVPLSVGSQQNSVIDSSSYFDWWVVTAPLGVGSLTSTLTGPNDGTDFDLKVFTSCPSDPLNDAPICQSATYSSIESCTINPAQDGQNYYLYAFGYLGSAGSYTISTSSTNQPDPAPEIVSVQYPSAISSDGYADIRVEVKNTGGGSSEGSISVSLEKEDHVVFQDQTTPNSRIYRAGNSNDQIWYQDIYQFIPDYTLVEGWDTDWVNGESHYINFRVYPKAGTSQLKFNVRSAMQNYATGSWINEPSSSGFTDQQGWPATQYVINVLPSVEAHISHFELISGDGLYGEGDVVTVNVRVTNSGTETRAFDVGFSVFDPDGNDEDAPYVTTIALSSNQESGDLFLAWTIPAGAKPGSWDGKVAVWDSLAATNPRPQKFFEYYHSRLFAIREPPRPTPTIVSITPDSSTPNRGDTVTFDVRIRNDGSSGTAYIGGSVTCDSAPCYISPTAYCNAPWVSAHLNAGEEKTVQIPWTVPSNATSATHGFIASSWSSCSLGSDAPICYLDGFCSNQISSKEDFNVFSVAPPLSILDIQPRLSTTTPSKGTALTITYTINNALDTAIPVTLGATIWDSNGVAHYDSANDKQITVPPGQHNYTRNFLIDFGLPEGLYDLTLGLWSESDTENPSVSKHFDNAFVVGGVPRAVISHASVISGSGAYGSGDTVTLKVRVRNDGLYRQTFDLRLKVQPENPFGHVFASNGTTITTTALNPGQESADYFVSWEIPGIARDGDWTTHVLLADSFASESTRILDANVIASAFEITNPFLPKLLTCVSDIDCKTDDPLTVCIENQCVLTPAAIAPRELNFSEFQRGLSNFNGLAYKFPTTSGKVFSPFEATTLSSAQQVQVSKLAEDHAFELGRIVAESSARKGKVTATIQFQEPALPEWSKVVPDTHETKLMDTLVVEVSPSEGPRKYREITAVHHAGEAKSNLGAFIKPGTVDGKSVLEFRDPFLTHHIKIREAYSYGRPISTKVKDTYAFSSARNVFDFSGNRIVTKPVEIEAILPIDLYEAAPKVLTYSYEPRVLIEVNGQQIAGEDLKLWLDEYIQYRNAGDVNSIKQLLARGVKGTPVKLVYRYSTYKKPAVPYLLESSSYGFDLYKKPLNAQVNPSEVLLASLNEEAILYFHRNGEKIPSRRIVSGDPVSIEPMSISKNNRVLLRTPTKGGPHILSVEPAFIPTPRGSAILGAWFLLDLFVSINSVQEHIAAVDRAETNIYLACGVTDDEYREHFQQQANALYTEYSQCQSQWAEGDFSGSCDDELLGLKMEYFFTQYAYDYRGCKGYEPTDWQLEYEGLWKLYLDLPLHNLCTQRIPIDLIHFGRRTPDDIQRIITPNTLTKEIYPSDTCVNYFLDFLWSGSNGSEDYLGRSINLNPKVDGTPNPLLTEIYTNAEDADILVFGPHTNMSPDGIGAKTACYAEPIPVSPPTISSDVTFSYCRNGGPNGYTLVGGSYLTQISPRHPNPFTVTVRFKGQNEPVNMYPYCFQETIIPTECERARNHNGTFPAFQSVRLSAGAVHEFKIPQTYTSTANLQWFLDELIVANGQSAYTYEPDTLDVGVHSLSVFSDPTKTNSVQRWSVTVESPPESNNSAARRALYVNPYTDEDVPFQVLQNHSFEITRNTTIPEDLSAYNVIVVTDIGAATADGAETLRTYVESGGGLVLISGAAYRLPFNSNADWVGASSVGYSNRGQVASVSIDNPLGSTLSSGDLLKVSASTESGAQAISGLSANATVFATWDDGRVYAYTFEYGSGRVYYQADLNPSQGDATVDQNIRTLLGAGINWSAIPQNQSLSSPLPPGFESAKNETLNHSTLVLVNDSSTYSSRGQYGSSPGAFVEYVLNSTPGDELLLSYDYSYFAQTNGRNAYIRTYVDNDLVNTFGFKTPRNSWSSAPYEFKEVVNSANPVVRFEYVNGDWHLGVRKIQITKIGVSDLPNSSSPEPDPGSVQNETLKPDLNQDKTPKPSPKVLVNDSSVYGSTGQHGSPPGTLAEFVVNATPNAALSISYNYAYFARTNGRNAYIRAYVNNTLVDTFAFKAPKNSWSSTVHSFSIVPSSEDISVHFEYVNGDWRLGIRDVVIT